MRLTAEQIYEKLLNEDKILTVKGQIKFFLGNVDIVVTQKDVVGNIMQEWLEGWLKKNEIEYLPSTNPQMPPDFYLNPDNKQENLLEVKAFNYKVSPGFDIADFNAFQQEVVREPYMLNVQYLIFGYEMSDDGVVTIKKIWLKKLWEITRPMKTWPLNLQIKRNVVHKIRPAKWYANRGTFKTFECLEDFLAALEECIYKNPDTRHNAADWETKMINSFKSFYNKELRIPRWYDIRDKYILKKP